MSFRSNFDLSLYLVTDRSLSNGRSLCEITEQAVAGGCTMVQLREKSCSEQEFLEMTEELLQITRPAGVPLIVNDRPDVAVKAGADGIHIGQSDMDALRARQIVGENMIIGLSVENVEQAIEAEQLPVDYLGLSPVFSTATKTDTAAALGLEGVTAISRVSSKPLAAIGGINTKNTADIIKAGADGIAVVSAICSAPSPYHAAIELRNRVDQSR